MRTAAQDSAAALGIQITNARIAEAIRQSGLTEAQFRDRLRSAGYDPSLADPFFPDRDPGVRPFYAEQIPPSEDFLAALQTLGILTEVGWQDEFGLEPEEELVEEELPPSGPGTVFGKEVFHRSSTAFDPVTFGPIDPGYRLGIGDELHLILTGEVELAYSLSVRNDGTVVIPQVGQISLAGLTLDGARTLLRRRAGASFSGLATGETELDLTVARLRSKAVFVIGEVENPGAYQISGLATVFHALARAGGPTESGSFRAVQLRRGGEVIETLDLYRYLLEGDASDDARLEQGDVVFVPLNTRSVEVTGAVRRPRVFELAEEEGFSELIRFSGGASAEASLDRVQIDRILPPDQREPGIDRVRIDVRLDGDIERAEGVPLIDGDILTFFHVGDLRRKTVAIVGAVHQPGEYELAPAMTVDSLIQRAQGFQPHSIRDHVLLRRLIPETGRIEALSIDFEESPGGATVLEEFDEVEVLDARRDYPEREVSVVGAVNNPGDHPFLEEESLKGFIDRVGGLLEGAHLVELARRKVGPAFNDTTSLIFSYEVGEDFREGGPASQMVLEPYDRVDVRLSPGYRPQRFVRVTGEFMNPGVYAISENVDRISDVIRRAGGTLPHAYGESFQLLRSGFPVAVDFSRAMTGDCDCDLLVHDGDELRISADPRVVQVQGAVVRPSLIQYQPDLSVEEYIERAGGATERGQLHKAVVQYPSGLSRRVKRRLWLFTSQPEVLSGSVITVPWKPETEVNAGEVFTRVFQVTSTLTSLVLTWVAITR